MAAESLYILTMAVFKVSLGAFFLRMLKDRLPRRLIQISISIFTLYSTAYFFSTVFNCGVPTGDRYLRKILSNECLAHDTALGLAYTHAALTAGTDLMFIGLSVAAVRHTRTTTREKWVIATILSVGAVYVTSLHVLIVTNHLIEDVRRLLSELPSYLSWSPNPTTSSVGCHTSCLFNKRG